MLYDGFKCFEEFVDFERFHYFKQLASIISVLKQRHISKSRHVEPIRLLIKDFIFKFNQLYEEKLFRINVNYYLLHLPDSVLMYGSLVTNSTFSVENTIGLLVRKIQTDTLVSQQVANKIITSSSILASFRSEKGVNLGLQFLANKLLPRNFELGSNEIKLTNRQVNSNLTSEELKFVASLSAIADTYTMYGLCLKLLHTDWQFSPFLCFRSRWRLVPYGVFTKGVLL